MAAGEIISQIVSNFLILPNSSFTQIKDEIEKSLGADIDILVSICPKAAEMFGERKYTYISDLKKLHYRVRNVISRFIRVASVRLFPMVIFIDDIQWASELTLNLLKAVLSKTQSFNLLLITAYRSKEITKPMQGTIALLKKNTEVIEIISMDTDLIGEYIKEYLNADVENIQNIAGVIYAVTGGRPLFIKDLIRLYDSNAVFSQGCVRGKYTVDLDRVKSSGIQRDYESILKSKIDGIPKEYKGLIDVLACLSGKCDYYLLLRAMGVDTEDLDRQLKHLSSQSIVLDSCDAEGSRQISFSHDILHKMALENLSPQKRSDLSFMLAELTLKSESCTEDEKTSLIASYILSCAPDVLKDDPERWIEILFKAGQQENQIASFDSAINMLDKALEIIEISGCGNSRLEAGILLEKAMALLITQKSGECENIIENLLQKYSDKDIVISIKKKQIIMFESRGEYKKVLETGVDILSLMGHRMGRMYFVPRIIKGMFFFTKRRINRLITVQKANNERALEILQIIHDISASAKLVNDEMFNLLLLDGAIVSLRNFVKRDLMGYCAYCLFLYTVIKRYKLAGHLESVIIMLMESPKEKVSLSMTYFMLGAFLHHFTHPIEESLAYQMMSIESGHRTGEFMFSCYSVAISTDTMNAMGMPLDERMEYINKYENDFLSTNYTIRYNLDVYKLHLAFLKSGDAWSLKGYEDVSLVEKWMENYPLMERYYLDNHIERGYELVVLMQDLFSQLDGYTYKTDAIFYCVLIRCAVQRRLSQKEKRTNKKHLKRLINELKYYVKIYKHNDYARLLIAEAEYRRAVKGEDDFAEMYVKAAEHASMQGNIKLEAVACMLAAQHSGTGKMRDFFATESVRLFSRMGADYIAQKYSEMFFPEKAKNDDSINEASDTSSETLALSVEDFLRAIKDADENEAVTYFMDYITANTSVTRCLIAFTKGSSLMIKYDKQKNRSAVVYSDMIDIIKVPGIAHRMLRYSARSRSECHITSRLRDDIFSKEPCISANSSICVSCLPVMFHDVLSGVVYMENSAGDIEAQAINFVRGAIMAMVSKFETISGVAIKEVFEKDIKTDILSDRETEIMKLLAEGCTNQKISEELSITTGTAKNHLSNIYQKLDVKNRTEAIKKARDLNIL